MGNGNAVKHGIYRSVLTPEEQTDYDSLELGGVDEELRLARIRLARALKAERDQVGSSDYPAIVDRLLGRIEGLELTRRKLAAAAGDDDDQVILIDPNPDID